MRVYTSVLSRFLRTSADDGPPKVPDRYTREDAEWFLNQPSQGHRNYGQPVSIATRNHRLGVINSFYVFASQMVIIGPDGQPKRLFTGIPPTLGIHKTRELHTPRGLSEAEIERFFSAIPDDERGRRDRCLFLFFLFSARRMQEVIRLQYGDIFHGMIIDEQGRSHIGWMYRWSGKGDAGQTTISELPDIVKKSLDSYLEQSGRLPLANDDPLFVGQAPGNGGGLPLDPYKHISHTTVNRAVKKYADRAGLDGKITAHSFRHTSAQMRYALGQDVRSIQRLLGHSSLETTSRYLLSFTSIADPGIAILSAKFAHLSGL